MALYVVGSCCCCSNAREVVVHSHVRVAGGGVRGAAERACARVQQVHPGVLQPHFLVVSRHVLCAGVSGHGLLLLLLLSKCGMSGTVCESRRTFCELRGTLCGGWGARRRSMHACTHLEEGAAVLGSVARAEPNATSGREAATEMREARCLHSRVAAVNSSA